MEKRHRMLFSWVMLLVMLQVIARAQLSETFYRSTCPEVEHIVRKAVTRKFEETFVTAQSTLRLFFHDCFVEGCDGSVLISSTHRGVESDASVKALAPDGGVERDAAENSALAGDAFETVIRAKEAVEEECPGVVSCADILALAARDVVSLTGGPSYSVELGRRDGLVSLKSRVRGNFPPPSSNVTRLTTMFGNKNLTQLDMIALSGAHTIGFSHCNVFSDRLYNFSSTTPLDPSMDPGYARELMAVCPRDADPNVVVLMDPSSPRTFDNSYFQNLLARKGIFTSDQVLLSDPASEPTIIDFANNPDAFNAAFAAAMRKLGSVGVKLGDEGEIRRDCSAFNS